MTYRFKDVRVLSHNEWVNNIPSPLMREIDNYIVDFVCFENRIIIEVDGGQHAAGNKKDRERDTYLKQYGFKVLRFWNNEVLQNTNGVLAVIRENCLSHLPPLSSPARGEELKKSRERKVTRLK